MMCILFSDNYLQRALVCILTGSRPTVKSPMPSKSGILRTMALVSAPLDASWTTTSSCQVNCQAKCFVFVDLIMKCMNVWIRGRSEYFCTAELLCFPLSRIVLHFLFLPGEDRGSWQLRGARREQRTRARDSACAAFSNNALLWPGGLCPQSAVSEWQCF